MSLTKLSLAGNDLIIPVHGSQVSDITAGDGKTANHFLQCSHSVQSPPEAVKSPTLEIQKVETGYLEDKEPETSVPEADAADLEVKS